MSPIVSHLAPREQARGPGGGREPFERYRNGRRSILYLLPLSSQLCGGGIAACLDTAMLFASTFEQAGLYPIVALPQGYALVGVWLQPEYLSTIVIDEAETLCKRVDLRELVLVETTCVTSHPALPFFLGGRTGQGHRPARGRRHVRCSRRYPARPITPHLPARFAVGPASTRLGSPPVPVEQALEEAPPLPDFGNPDPEEKRPETPQGRLDRWKRKLLDLTSRNPLLNHRAPKTSLRIICPEPGLLEDKLAAGVRIQIKAVPTPSAQQQDEALHQHHTGEVIDEGYAHDEVNKRSPGRSPGGGTFQTRRRDLPQDPDGDYYSGTVDFRRL